MLPVPQARELLLRVRERTDKVLVGFSGGKDSIVTLDLAVEAFGPANVVAFAMYLVRGLEVFEKPIDYYGRRYGVRVEYVPHWTLGRMYKHAVLMPHRADAHKWREMKIGDIERMVRERTGIDWIAYGHRAGESPQRRGMLSSCKGFSEKPRRVYPIAFWHTPDVFAWLRHRRLPEPPTFGKNRLSGVDLRPETLAYLRDNFPRDYARICEVFPFAPVQLKRCEFYSDAGGVDDGEVPDGQVSGGE